MSRFNSSMGQWGEAQPEFISIRGDGVDAQVMNFRIQDGDDVIYYIPSLQMSSYGANDEEARSMMDEIISDYWFTLLKQERGVIAAELRKYGWTKTGFSRKKFQYDNIVNLEQLRSDLSLSDDAKIERQQYQVA